jgi:hypothetical protein
MNRDEDVNVLACYCSEWDVFLTVGVREMFCMKHEYDSREDDES